MGDLTKSLKATAIAYGVILVMGDILGDIEPNKVETTCLQTPCSSLRSELPEPVEGNTNQLKENDMSAKLLADPKVAALVEKEVAKAVKAERKRCLDAVKNATKELTAEVKDPAPFDTDDE